MAEQELIDSIVTNESLGIRKKPSLLKILLIAVILLVAAYVAYMFYVKANTVTEVLPTLELGQPLEKTSQPIRQFSSELGQLTNMADEQKASNDLIFRRI